MTTSLKQIEEQLDELKKCFDLSNMTQDGGQEFLYSVSKRFGAVFTAQSDQMKFSPYPYRQKSYEQTQVLKYSFL